MSIQTSVDSVVQTTTDKKFEQAKHIYVSAERFTDATGVLEDLCSAICDQDYSRPKPTSGCSFREEVHHTSAERVNQNHYHCCYSSVTTCSSNVCPWAEWKQEETRGCHVKKMSYSLQKEMIVRHITEGTKINNKHDTSTPPAKRYRRSAVCVSPTVIEQSINLPAPQSGTAYNKIEVVSILSKILDVGTRSATSCSLRAQRWEPSAMRAPQIGMIVHVI